MSSPLILRFGLPFAAWLFFFYESIETMVRVWGQSRTYEHGFLIVPIALWVVWQEKDRFHIKNLSTNWIPAALLFLPCLLWMIGKTADIALFEHVAAVVSLQLIIWALVGNAVAKTFYFPILYLVFCIPFGEELVPYLQSITADLSVAMVRLSGIPIYREGMYLSIPNGHFEVAEACSGIRFLISSIAMGSLFSYMFFTKWWKLIAFVAFSCLLPIIANGFRAYGIIIIGHLSDMEHATGADHLVYGWLFFSIVTMVNFFIAYLLKDKIEARTVYCKTSVHGESRFITRVLPQVTILLMLASFSLWENSSRIQEHSTVPAPVLPNNMVQQNASEIGSSLWGISFPHAQKTVRSLTQDTQTEFFSARYLLKQKHGELISQENQLFDQDNWSLAKKESVKLQPVSNEHFQAEKLELVNSYGRKMTVFYWYCIDRFCSTSKLKLKLQKAYQLMSGKPGYADVKAIASVNLSDSELRALAEMWITADIERNQ